jgi:protein-disulfide isomerase
MAAHPRDVRLVYRNLPLTDLHPHAELAARAGACADQQGKFWELHDAMFENQKALDPDALKATAARLGVDGKAFARCLDDASATAAVLDADAQSAAALGLGGTPYFFINGRPLQGVGSQERFEAIITEELNGRQTSKERATTAPAAR